MHTIVENFCLYYKEFNQDSIAGLDRIYDQNAVFEDPIGKVEVGTGKCQVRSGCEERGGNG